MFIKQVSVFLENRVGALRELTSLLGANGMDIRELSVADTQNFGIIRMIFRSDILDKVVALLKESGYTARVNHVICAEIEDKAGGLGGLLFPVVLIAVMYFLMIRPQMKRQKEHKAMLDKLSRGDEVIIGGGIAGTVSDIGDSFITVEVASGVQLRVQKTAVANVLPKGTLKSA